MNKYLEKVAEKIELEPGYHWDTTKKEVNFSSRQGKRDYLNRAHTIRSGVWSIVPSLYGAALGGVYATKKGFGRPAFVGSMLGGATLLGGGMFGLNMALGSSSEKGDAESKLDKVQKKHQETINRIEGWGDGEL